MNGCFWHRHDCPAGLRDPQTHHDFWVAKRVGNAERDAPQLLALRELGWEALVVWECETGDPGVLLERLEAFFAIPLDRPAGAADV